MFTCSLPISFTLVSPSVHPFRQVTWRTSGRASPRRPPRPPRPPPRPPWCWRRSSGPSRRNRRGRPRHLGSTGEGNIMTSRRDVTGMMVRIGESPIWGLVSPISTIVSCYSLAKKNIYIYLFIYLFIYIRLFNSLPWKIHPFLRTVNHLFRWAIFHGYVK